MAPSVLKTRAMNQVAVWHPCAPISICGRHSVLIPAVIGLILSCAATSVAQTAGPAATSDGCSAEFAPGLAVAPETTTPKPLSHIPNVGFPLVDNRAWEKANVK